MHNRYDRFFPASIALAVGLILLGLLLDDPARILPGLWRIILIQDVLITDYVAIAGPGAALANAGIVTAITVCLIKFTRIHFNGFSLVEIGLMAGFSLFGKNCLNIWPIIFGTWLYARYQKEAFSKHITVALLATSLSPLVSYMALGSVHRSIPLGIFTGVAVGFLLPPLAAYTHKIQSGMNLYNMGFACGLLAMMIVPVLTAFGDTPDAALYWDRSHNLSFGLAIGGLCLVLILLGLTATGRPMWAVWAGYRRLLQTSGRVPSDYLRMFDTGPVLINTGVNGILGILYIIAVGGSLNGPTLGGIFTIMGFSAYGKHAFNILPVMVGVALGAYGVHQTPDYPPLQLAGLFGTTLAPIAGYFGWPAGILAGFIHSALVLQTGGPVAGLNLYNNGFSGGLIAIVLFPVISSISRRRRQLTEDEEYYQQFSQDAPINPPLPSEDKEPVGGADRTTPPTQP